MKFEPAINQSGEIKTFVFLRPAATNRQTCLQLPHTVSPPYRETAHPSPSPLQAELFDVVDPGISRSGSGLSHESFMPPFAAAGKTMLSKLGPRLPFLEDGELVKDAYYARASPQATPWYVDVVSASAFGDDERSLGRDKGKPLQPGPSPIPTCMQMHWTEIRSVRANVSVMTLAVVSRCTMAIADARREAVGQGNPYGRS
ncbi:hypothetical protein O9K51_09164 [Purpureocillium lavendulum]|uniref:Uncharacterized protein n=1 Tax=Purpureocillium lavendulum TaxID=1247861 RepID=A0AB34FIB7_9HYPO|nr:hypothetical protein O9K51_09164 [Purpureocillium lavendulum]